MAILFSPININNLRMANRVVFPPMANGMAGENGYVTEQHIQHYAARSGAGLIIVEASYVSRTGRLSNRHLGNYDDGCLPGLTILAQAIHQAGTKCGIQITHCGSCSKAEIIGQVPVAPSVVRHPKEGNMPRELTLAEMSGLVQEFVLAARRAKQAGFDLVEINGAHGYLLNQFLSPYTNRRTDEYGGSWPNRLRFPLEIVAAVRREVGAGFPVFYRLGCDDHVEGGLTLKEGALAAVALAEAGVDVLDLSGGLMGARVRSGEGYFVYLAEKIKPLVQVPVLITGGITVPETAERILAEDKADLVGIGRAMLANSHWVEEANRELK